MASSLDSFLEIVQRSRLVEDSALQQQLKLYREQANSESAPGFAQQLVHSRLVTSWQAGKLLQGKHKGFFLGRYKLLKLLGKGGMSSVYLAEHMVMRRRCAIKVLPWKLVKNSSYLQRFHREAQAVAALDDPHIVRAYDVDHEVDGNLEIHFLVMEYVEGQNLFELVQAEGPLEPRRAAEYIRQGALGLQHAHEAGMVHRDVKPGNFLVDRSGSVKLMDLGLAQLQRPDDSSGALTIQHDERVLGTADYLAPEQAVDSHRVDARADVYGLGCTFFYLLVGRPPFSEGALAQRLLAHQTAPPPSIRDLRSDVPEELVDLINRMLLKDRDRRVQTAGQVADELKRFLRGSDALTGEPVPLRSASNTEERSQIAPGTGGGQRGGEPSTERPSESASDDPLFTFLSNLKDTDAVLTKQPSTVKAADALRPLSSHSAQPSAGSEDAGSALAVSGAGLVLDANTASAIQPSSVIESGRQAARATQRRLRLRALFGAIALGLLTCVLIYLWFRPRSPAPEFADQSASRTPNSIGRFNATPGDILEVGPDGHFGSLTEALQYVQQGSLSSTGSPIREIRIAGGITLTEGIRIDNSGLGGFPKRFRITAPVDQPARLRPEDDDPVLQLNSLEHLFLENLILDAEGRHVAVQLEGFCSGVRLQNVRFDRITGVGLRTDGVSGLQSQPVRIERCRFQGSQMSSVGIELHSNASSDIRSLRIVDCQFLGPQLRGISSLGAAADVEVRNCVFSRVGTGIEFDAGAGSLADWRIENNTFHRCSVGVACPTSPRAKIDRLEIARNLFVAIDDRTVMAPAGRPFGDWLEGAAPSDSNWTDGSPPDEPNPAEARLFSEAGRWNQLVEFLSEDDRSPDFLRPVSEDLLLPSSAGPRRLDYVGARRP